jgi:hypothetical protein
MILLSRSIRLPVVVIVLTLAPMEAWAECAWVLWEQMAPHVYQPIEGFAKKRECESKAQQLRSSGTTYRCFPDTFDPRGPKASAR